MQNKGKSEIMLELVLLVICWAITDYLMEYVWHSESGIIEFLTLAGIYIILYIPISLIIRHFQEKKNPTQKVSGFETITPSELAEIRQLKAQGKQVRAISMVRGLTGQSRNASKEFVERL